MKAFAAFWMRLLAFTLLVMIAGVFLIDRESPPKTGIGGDGVQSAGTLSPVYASPIQVKLVDLIPASLSGETNQDSEPFLAVQTVNPQVMVASAFTPNPVSSSSNAPVYVSEDGGNSWVLNAITPVSADDLRHHAPPCPRARTIRAATFTPARWLARHPSLSTSPNRMTSLPVPL